MSSSVKNDIDIWPPILVFTNKHNIVPSIQLCSFYFLIYYWRVKIRKINWISCFPWCESIFKDEWMKQGMGRDLTGVSRAQPQKFLKYDVLRSSKMSISACVFLFEKCFQIHFRFNLMTFYTNKLLWIYFFGELWYHANWLNDNLSQS